MEEYIENPLKNASSETVKRLCAELNIDYIEDLSIYTLFTMRTTHAACAAELSIKQVETHPHYTLTDMHTHLKNLIDNGFHIKGLSDDEKEYFLTWSEKFEMMPSTSTPFEIYYSAHVDLLATLRTRTNFRDHLLTNIAMMRKIEGSESDFRVYKRIAHVLNALLRLPVIPLALLESLSRLLHTMSYQPPWDAESVIYDSLKFIGNLCGTHFPDGEASLQAAFTDDLSTVSLKAGLLALQGSVLDSF
jgi:hypothetical protein